MCSIDWVSSGYEWWNQEKSINNNERLVKDSRTDEILNNFKH